MGAIHECMINMEKLEEKIVRIEASERKEGGKDYKVEGWRE